MDKLEDMQDNDVADKDYFEEDKDMDTSDNKEMLAKI
jgi:hypothetical protein